MKPAAQDAPPPREELLQRIIDILPIRIFWKDKDLRFLGCNAIFAQDAGKASSADIIGKDDFQMNWKAQAKGYQEDDRGVMNSGKPKLGFEEPQTTPNGDTIWLKTSKVPLTDVQGNIMGILGMYEDITQQKKMEDDIRKSRELLQLKVSELEAFNRLAVDREIKMVELKEKIEALEKKFDKA